MTTTYIFKPRRESTYDVHHDKVVRLSGGLFGALGVQGALQGGGAQGGLRRVDLWNVELGVNDYLSND